LESSYCTEKDGILLKSSALFCGHEGFSHGLDPTNFHAPSLVFSALIQSCQIHLTQGWYFLSYSKKCAPAGTDLKLV